MSQNVLALFHSNIEKLTFPKFFCTIPDNEACVFSETPSDVSVNTDLGQPTAIVTWIEPIVTDNSGIFTVTSSHKPGSAFDVGTSTVTYTATDARGNKAVFTFNVTVKG